MPRDDPDRLGRFGVLHTTASASDQLIQRLAQVGVEGVPVTDAVGLVLERVVGRPALVAVYLSAGVLAGLVSVSARPPKRAAAWRCFSATMAWPWSAVPVAVALLFIVAQVPPQRLMLLAVPLYVAGVVLLLGVEFFGITKKGATRWLNVGMVIQPSEILKIAMPLMLAWWFQKREGQLRPLDFIVAGVLLAVWALGIVSLLGIPGQTIAGLVSAGAAGGRGCTPSITTRLCSRCRRRRRPRCWNPCCH